MTQSRIHYLLALMSLFFMLAPPVSAQIVISEVMYDLEGSDSKREWVEIFNSGDDIVSLSGWRFYENDSNHKLTLVQGDESIKSGEYAIIVNDLSTFLLDWPQFSGTIFDSSFSLSNSGEKIIIRDSELTDIDSVTYSSELGAKGDGNTLYYTGSKWSFGSPTPGSGSLVVSSNSSSDENNQVNDNSSSNTNITLPMKKISAHIINSEDGNRIVTVGADSLFKGRVIGFSGDVISDARFQWSFGDGGKGEGKSILYYYKYPGKYIVVLNVSSGEYSSTDRILVSAIPADVFIANAGKDKIELINKSDNEVNLSWWMFKVNEDSFVIPENTIVLPRQSIMFSSEVTGLHPSKVSDVSFLYPNGSAVSYKSEYKETAREDKKILETQKNKIRILPAQSIVGKEILITQIDKNASIKRSIKAEVDTQVNNQSANVSKAVDIKEKNKSIFWFSLIGIILLGSFSVVVLRRKSRGEIRIIE